MKKALVITGGYINFNLININAGNYDIIIAADSGCLAAEKFNITPAVCLGDFDSARVPENSEHTIIAPTEKDETDTMLACMYAEEHGCRQIEIVGGTGGRADHFLSNVFYLEALLDRGIFASITDGENTLRILKDETFFVSDCGYFSLFALDNCIISVSGCKYPLENYKLSRANPFAISNEVVGDKATITVSGKVILCESKK